MDQPKLILFYDVCRLCLVKPGVDDIFQKSGLLDDIFLCTGVKVLNTDNLPTKICIECSEIVTNAKRLRVLAITNNNHLKTLFDEPTSAEPPHIDSTDVANETANISESVISSPLTNTQGNKKRRNSSKSTDCHTSEPAEKKIISVRKDLFVSSETVSSSTKEVPHIEEKPEEADSKQIKKEDSSDLACENCSKSFETPKKLHAHQRIHNRKFGCPLDACGKKFATKGDLEKHVRIHTGEKPYTCNICRKGFAQRCTLKAHRDKVHNVEDEFHIELRT